LNHEDHEDHEDYYKFSLRDLRDLRGSFLQKAMRAILFDDSQKLYIGEAPEPVAAEGELLVRVKATALNRADLLQKKGLYPPPPGASPILGLEIAGVVEQTGERVCALLAGGGYAELVTIPAGMAIPIPDNLSFEEAAAIPEVFLTAYLALFRLGGIKPGHTVLIHAGASGVGTAAIQLAREAGARSIVTVGSEKKREACLALGADVAIEYKKGPFDPAVKSATNDAGVNIILDPVGAPYWNENISCLAVDGRLILIATMGGAKVEGVDLRQILSRRLQIIGTTLRARAVDEKIELTREFAAFALERFADGRLVPVIDNVWDWTDANEAHRYMEENRNVGKIILRLGNISLGRQDI
jgi:tumor protein p53-inducible protein 3